MTADVTIGIPAYNNQATVQRTIASALLQTYPGCVIHISDNASTDLTASLAVSIAGKFPTVTVSHQTPNRGPTGNFKFLVNAARTPFFMWLAADDVLAPDYVRQMRARLMADPSLSACVSRVRFVRRDGSDYVTTTTAPILEADVADRLAHYLAEPGDNARMYALFRTEALRDAIPAEHMHAFDFTVIAAVLTRGRFDEVPEVLMTRDATPPEDYTRAVPRDNPTALTRLFPLLPFTRDLLGRQKLPRRFRLLRQLVKLNIDHHFSYTQQFHPTYAAITRPLRWAWRYHIGWRLAQ